MRGIVTGLAMLLAAPPALAQGMDNSAAVAEQKAAIGKLAFLHGEWRGTVSITNRSGKRELVQTERAGPMLDGTVLVIEGAGFADDGSKAFNAFAVISFDSDTDRYWITSWSDGRNGKFPLTVRDDGFDWETPGPGGAVIRYKATVKDGVWQEVGSFERSGGPSFPFIDLKVTRLGAIAWPAGGAVPAKP
jgi:hypothetical protein